MQQLSQNYRKANHNGLCQLMHLTLWALSWHKMDNVCLRLTQQAHRKSMNLKPMLENFAELGPLRVMDLIVVLSYYYSYFPCCYHPAHLLIMFASPSVGQS